MALVKGETIIIARIEVLLAQGLWISSGTPASSTTKTGRHDIPGSWNIAESGVEHQNSKNQFQMSFTYVLRSEFIWLYIVCKYVDSTNL
jgi:hypothetical protein